MAFTALIFHECVNIKCDLHATTRQFYSATFYTVPDLLPVQRWTALFSCFSKNNVHCMLTVALDYMIYAAQTFPSFAQNVWNLYSPPSLFLSHIYSRCSHPHTRISNGDCYFGRLMKYEHFSVQFYHKEQSCTRPEMHQNIWTT